MAHQLPLFPHYIQSTLQVGLAAMTLFFCAMVLFMCASHSRNYRRSWRACYEPDDNEDTTSIQHIQHGNNDEIMCSDDEQGVSVWQKNILMGGKCQLPDFSGIIIYDADGNVVAPAKKSRSSLF
ncbi:hypothetical protein FNV43_RR12565 [Rhamnella rubrinervis]|uniref:Uncharacterized protein n=1 Tax=Rhamnella rubrinervis TaxID=2594499 RepID=A0A8K0MIE3_9ROSA|nr:hypothetical protein FNV43_RR12565 [Rhamnella rubrinervis]